MRWSASLAPNAPPSLQPEFLILNRLPQMVPLECDNLPPIPTLLRLVGAFNPTSCDIKSVEEGADSTVVLTNFSYPKFGSDLALDTRGRQGLRYIVSCMSCAIRFAEWNRTADQGPHQLVVLRRKEMRGRSRHPTGIAP